MRAIHLAVAATLLVATATPAFAGPAEDATAAVTSLIDKFNEGDAAAFLSGHEDNALIIDEFAPYVWSGSGSAQRWFDAYMKDSAARGVSAAHMDYGNPLQANSDGTIAYIVLPTTYHFQQKGQKLAGKGNMTFIMHKEADGWKIASWTYSAPTPSAE